MGGWCNGETRRRSLAPRGVGSLHGPSKWSHLGTLLFRVASLALLLPCLNDLPLSFPDVYAALKLLPHRGVLGVEAWGEAGETDVYYRSTPLRVVGSRGEGAGGVDDVAVG